MLKMGEKIEKVLCPLNETQAEEIFASDAMK